MEIWTRLLTNFLNCGYLDIKFLEDLIDNNNIDIDIEDIRSNYWELNINTIIYEVIRQIAEEFIENHKEEICNILDLWNLDDYISQNYLYEIFTNSIDSHLWFINDQIQELFEKAGYRV